MGKANLVKRLIALIIYAGELLLAIYLGIAIFQNAMFDASGLLFMIIIILVPSAIATFLFVSTIEDESKRYKIVKVLLYTIFVLYILVLFSILFMGFRRPIAFEVVNRDMASYFKFSSNFIPFKTITLYLGYLADGTINRNIAIENLIGNLLIFAPMGILLPCLFKSLRKFSKFAIVMLIMLISVEVGQLLTFTGSIDIDDVILNLLGAALFFCLAKTNICQRLLRRIYILN